MTEPFYTDKAAVRRSFEAAAQTYDQAAVLQREVADRMLSRLEYIRIQPECTLDAGAGTGYCGEKLRALHPKARLIELDIAQSMLQVSRNKQTWWQRKLPFLSSTSPWQVCADIESIPLANESVNMVWSNLAMQWCNTPDVAFAEFNRVLKVDGLLMFSTLGPDTLKELRAAFAGLDGASHVNQFIDMHDLGDALVKAGFATPVMDMEYLTLTYEDIRAILHDLKAIGAHNSMTGRRRGLMGKHAWQQVVTRYESLRQQGKLPATYEVVYGHAWKPQPAAPTHTADGHQIIPFPTRHKRP